MINKKLNDLLQNVNIEIEENDITNIKNNVINRINYINKIYKNEKKDLCDKLLLEILIIEKEYYDKYKKYEQFKKNYNKKIYLTIIIGIILPLFLSIFLFDIQYKLMGLIYIICSILISCAYIIILEYLNNLFKIELNLIYKFKQDKG